MASLDTINAAVADFRESISESMRDFISYTKQRLSDFAGSVDSSRSSELDYIDAAISEMTAELDEFNSKASANKADIQFPLETDSFKDTLDLSTLTKYTPLYKDITTGTNDIVDTLLPIINLPTTKEAINSLVSKQEYTTKYLSCFDSVVEACQEFRSDIGSPSELFNSILYLENERNLYITKLAFLQEDIKVSSKGFRKPNSLNVFGRTEVLEKYNREFFTKYQEALSKVNDQLAALYAKAIDILLTKESFSVSMSSKLLDSLIDASKMNTEFAIEEVKLAFLKYSTESDSAIKKLESERTAIKLKEEAFIKAAQLLFEVQAERAKRGFEAIRKKVEADITLTLKDTEIGAEEIKLRVDGGVKELEFLARRLDYWANVMGQQAQDKSSSIAQANAVYQKALSTFGVNAIALATKKGS